MNQVLAVNLATANFILKASTPSCRIKAIDDALARMERHINDALILLGKDVANSSNLSNEDIGETNPFKFISPETVSACDRACTFIGDAEILLSRATSLLTKFSGDVDLVETFLENNLDNQQINATTVSSRLGILKSIHSQQKSNSGIMAGKSVGLLPTPSVREYILHNRDEKCPCQLTACIGGTHGLEDGGTNSTRGGLVLALNKSVFNN